MTKKTNNWLYATKETQGNRSNDFNWCNDLEPLMFGFECDGGGVDDNCGCKRAMSGLNTAKGTTTMVVAPAEDVAKLTKGIKDHLVKNWGLSEEEAEGFAKEDTKQILEVANTFSKDAILEKRGNKFVKRI